MQDLSNISYELEKLATEVREFLQLLGAKSKARLVLVGELRRWKSNSADRQRTWLEPPGEEAHELIDYITNFAIDEGLVKSHDDRDGIMWLYGNVRVTVEFLDEVPS